MLIVDAHQHYWRLQRGDYAWLSHVNGVLYRDFLPADLLPILLSQGLAGTVLVQAAATEEETKFLFELAERHATIAGVAERLMWGSDWPVVTARATYECWLATARDLIHRHAPGSETQVLAANAIEFYRLQIPTSTHEASQ
jgi:predicted TIM-barrel fold metal-dependent hydrolase